MMTQQYFLTGLFGVPSKCFRIVDPDFSWGCSNNLGGLKFNFCISSGLGSIWFGVPFDFFSVSSHHSFDLHLYSKYPTRIRCIINYWVCNPN